jgi:hypothetical protein
MLDDGIASLDDLQAAHDVKLVPVKRVACNCACYQRDRDSRRIAGKVASFGRLKLRSPSPCIHLSDQLPRPFASLVCLVHRNHTLAQMLARAAVVAPVHFAALSARKLARLARHPRAQQHPLSTQREVFGFPHKRFPPQPCCSRRPVIAGGCRRICARSQARQWWASDRRAMAGRRVLRVDASIERGAGC